MTLNARTVPLRFPECTTESLDRHTAGPVAENAGIGSSNRSRLSNDRKTEVLTRDARVEGGVPSGSLPGMP